MVFYVLQVIYEKWCKVLDSVPARDSSFEEELERQKNNEELRKQFAEKASEVGAYIEARHAALAELSMQGKDTMEEQLECVKTFQSETLGYQPKLDEVESCNQVICSLFCFQGQGEILVMKMRALFRTGRFSL